MAQRDGPGAVISVVGGGGGYDARIKLELLERRLTGGDATGSNYSHDQEMAGAWLGVAPQQQHGTPHGVSAQEGCQPVTSQNSNPGVPQGGRSVAKRTRRAGSEPSGAQVPDSQQQRASSLQPGSHAPRQPLAAWSDPTKLFQQQNQQQLLQGAEQLEAAACAAATAAVSSLPSLAVAALPPSLTAAAHSNPATASLVSPGPGTFNGTVAAQTGVGPGQSTSAPNPNRRKRPSSPPEHRPQLPSPSPPPMAAAAGGPTGQAAPAGRNAQAKAASKGTVTGGGQRAGGGAAALSNVKAGAPGAGGATPRGPGSRGQQTKLNSFYPVVIDASSRDSEMSGGGGVHSGGAPSHFPGNGRAQPLQQGMGMQPQVLFGGAANGGAGGPSHASPAQRTAGLIAGGAPGSGGGGTGACMLANGVRAGSLEVILEEGGALVQTPSTAGQPQSLHLQQQALDKATAALQQQLAAKDRQLLEVQEKSRQQVAGHERAAEEARGEAAAAVTRCVALEAELSRTGRATEERETRLRAELTREMSTGTRERRELLRLQLAAGAVRLGGIAVHRSGMTLQEVWEDGHAAALLAARQAALASQREDVDAARKALRKKLAPPPARAAAAAAAAAAVTTGQGPEGGYMDGLEFVTQDEIYKMRLAALKREEEAVREESERLAGDKSRHIRQLKRLRDEEGSRFGCGATVLGGRFVLLNLLGKGGFSEVFKAYDLRELRVVAAKVHQLNPGWSEARKASYVKHAIREVNIQKGLRHPHIVGLVDILEVDAHCFATVLDYCEGGDLDTLLREHLTLPEKEARIIISQVMSGLSYLAQPGKRIIHYDLKPANILFDGLGVAKITDFGLSKVVETGETQGMELTSQGAGTYWYLPPECFEVGGPTAPKITNKVDVWSVGVIFYQMLFGKRPYGEGLSQEQIMRDRVVLGAREVEFPTKPSCSVEAKDFIRRCLATRVELRWDVAAAAADPYICGGPKKA